MREIVSTLTVELAASEWPTDRGRVEKAVRKRLQSEWHGGARVDILWTDERAAQTRITIGGQSEQGDVMDALQYVDEVRRAIS